MGGGTNTIEAEALKTAFKTGRLPASSNDTNPSLIALIELRDRGENP